MAALDLMGQLAETADRNLDNRLAVATLTYDIAKQLAEAKRNPEALDLYGRAEDQYRQIQQLAPAFSQARFMQCSIHLDRASIYLAQDLSVDCLRELDQVARISDELKDKADILLMQGGFRAIVTGAAAMRMIQTAAIREGCLKTLADEQRFDELLGQATAWGAYSGLAADHFVAAQALAYGVDKSAGAAGQADAVAAEVAEKLATTAVAELRRAAKGGHFRRESRFGGLFASLPATASLA